MAHEQDPHRSIVEQRRALLRLMRPASAGLRRARALQHHSVMDTRKRWGFVSARPSEYLVVTRDGRADPHRSGQGARVFKWPWLEVALVPTTLQRIEFTADQITREKVGVEVSGIAVFRIAEPLLAYRVISSLDEVSVTLREMFVGAARRLIANL